MPTPPDVLDSFPSPAAGIDELNCPLCGYDLHGLPENRCPECGHAFDLNELRARAHRRLPWFFESAPPRLQRRAFLLTTLSSLWPPDFWRRVQPTDAIDGIRLRKWVMIWAAIALVSMAAFVLAYTVRVHVVSSAPPPTSGSWQTSRVSIATAGGADSLGRAFEIAVADKNLQIVAGGAFFAFAWPPVAVAVMSLFGTTFALAGIRPGHLWRCALYAIPSLLVPPIIRAILLCCGSAIDRDGVLMATAAIWLCTAHLFMAHVKYLRIRHAAAHALVVQFLIGLSAFAVIVLIEWG